MPKYNSHLKDANFFVLYCDRFLQDEFCQPKHH